MNAMIKPVAEVFQVNTRLFSSVIDGISESDLHFPFQQGNPAIWIAGHTVLSRYSVRKLCGNLEGSNHEELFKRGTRYEQDKTYPALTEIMDEWDAITSSMLETLDTASEKLLLEEPPFKFPVSENNVVNGISFLLLHESYHIGQISVIRKSLGYDWHI